MAPNSTASAVPSAAAIAGGSVKTIVTETVAGSRVLMTVDGFSKIIKEETEDGLLTIKSERFRAGGHFWYIEYIDVHDDDDDRVSVDLVLDHDEDDPCADDDEVKVLHELALLNRAGEMISSATSFNTFSCDNHSWEIIRYPDDLSIRSTKLYSLLGDSFQIRCDITVVKEIAAVPPPDLHQHLAGLLSSRTGADVTFQVGGELFPAHRCVLGARSSVFLAELFGKESTAAPVRVDDVEPKVFKALLHFIYTDALPEVDDDKVAMAQGLLVAADKFRMERLKLICGDVLCNYVDARTAMALLELAHSHGCRRLKEACVKIIKDLLAKVAP